MPLSPALWGASLACALGGAFAGTSFGSTPVIADSDVTAYAVEHPDSGDVNHGRGQESLPDHYPLVTREGVVPVERLGDRGLYSQARFRPLYDNQAAVLAAAAWKDEPVAAPAVVTDAEPVRVAAESSPHEDAETRPLAPVQNVASLGNGQAKTINVAAALALR